MSYVAKIDSTTLPIVLFIVSVSLGFILCFQKYLGFFYLFVLYTEFLKLAKFNEIEPFSFYILIDVFIKVFVQLDHDSEFYLLLR